MAAPDTLEIPIGTPTPAQEFERKPSPETKPEEKKEAVGLLKIASLGFQGFGGLRCHEAFKACR